MKVREIWEITRNVYGKYAYFVGLHLCPALRPLIFTFLWKSNPASSNFAGREVELRATWLSRKASVSDRYINTVNVFDLWFKMQPIVHRETFNWTRRGGRTGGRGGVFPDTPYCKKHSLCDRLVWYTTNRIDVMQYTWSLFSKITFCFSVQLQDIFLVSYYSHNWRKLHNEELLNCCSPNIILINSKRMKFTKYVYL
jgi:hypothetical protein